MYKHVVLEETPNGETGKTNNAWPAALSEVKARKGDGRLVGSVAHSMSASGVYVHVIIESEGGGT